MRLSQFNRTASFSIYRHFSGNNNMNVVKKTITLGDGRIVEIETGRLAKQAAGSVVLKVGDTMLLATVTCAKDAKEDVDFMPLSVEYKEKFAAAGRFPE